MQGNLCTEIRAIYNANVLICISYIARVFKCNPRMTSFKKHREHLFPKIFGFYFFKKTKLAAIAFIDILPILYLKRLSEEGMQIRSFVRREEIPGTVYVYLLHKQIRYPIRSIHIMSSTSFVPDIFSKNNKVFNIVMPSLEISATRSTPLTSLVYSYKHIVKKFPEENSALSVSVSTVYICITSSEWG